MAQLKETDEDYMDHGVALFNCHVNKAQKRAIDAFKRKFGVKKFDEKIQPYIDKGFMSIFDDKPNKWTKFFVDKVHQFVNEIPKKNPEVTKRIEQIQDILGELDDMGGLELTVEIENIYDDGDDLEECVLKINGEYVIKWGQ